MSHTTTIYDWLLGVQNTLKDVRVGYDHEVVLSKLNALSAYVMAFVSKHDLMLLGGALSLSLGFFMGYLGYKWYAARNKLQDVSVELWKSELNYSMLEIDHLSTHELLVDAQATIESYSDQLSEMRTDMETLLGDLEEWRESHESLEVEHHDLEEKLEEVKEELSDMEDSRDWFENDRDDYQEQASNLQSELDEVQDKVETLEQMVDTYKTLVSELETNQTLELKLAA